jgi:uncharacterized protein (TIGR00251 family)
MDNLKIDRTNGGVVFLVKVVPSSRTAITGVLDGMLKVKIAAPAEKGRANAALVELIAKKLAIRKNALRIIRGRTTAVKEILAENVSADQIANLAAK